MNYEDSMRSWLAGIEYEAKFWDNYFSTHGGAWPQDFVKRTASEYEFRLTHLIDKNISADDINVLDVGSACISCLGSKTPNGKINLTAVDPLAHIYDAILKKYNCVPYVRTEFSTVESLDDRFAQNSFDIVVMENALDHAFNPLLGIYQMLGVVKIGGILYMKHSENEAQYTNGRGFHQWNITAENNHLLIWNDDAKYDITELLSGIADVDVKLESYLCSANDTRNSVIVNIVKRKASQIDLRNDKFLANQFFIDALSYLMSKTYRDLLGADNPWAVLKS